MHTEEMQMQNGRTSDAEPRAIAAGFLDQLERAWNRADGPAFAAPFIEAGAFVDIRGELHHGRANIAQGHDYIFNTIYKGSTLRFELLDAGLIAPGCMLFHSQGRLDVPSGPVKGVIESMQTIVAVQGGATSCGVNESAWRLAAFHNTVQR
jgi:uncharacterized protein (TIGR02246 family)